MNQETFEENDWSGSYYELAVQFKGRLPDEILRDCIIVLWSNPLLRGPWESKRDLLDKSAGIKSIHIESLEDSYYGILDLQNAGSMGCASWTVREEEDGHDWLLFIIPVGMLEKRYEVQYPLIPACNPFLTGIEQVYAGMAQAIYSTYPFEMALIGEEVSGLLYAETLTKDEIELGGVILPTAAAEKFEGLAAGVRLGEELRLYPNRINAFGA